MNKPHDCNSAYTSAVRHLAAEPAAASVTIEFERHGYLYRATHCPDATEAREL